VSSEGACNESRDLHVKSPGGKTIRSGGVVYLFDCTIGYHARRKLTRTSKVGLMHDLEISRACAVTTSSMLLLLIYVLGIL
jgi:hypothetical protein